MAGVDSEVVVLDAVEVLVVTSVVVVGTMVVLEVGGSVVLVVVVATAVVELLVAVVVGEAPAHALTMRLTTTRRVRLHGEPIPEIPLKAHSRDSDSRAHS